MENDWDRLLPVRSEKFYSRNDSIKRESDFDELEVSFVEELYLRYVADRIELWIDRRSNGVSVDRKYAIRSYVQIFSRIIDYAHLECQPCQRPPLLMLSNSKLIASSSVLGKRPHDPRARSLRCTILLVMKLAQLVHLLTANKTKLFPATWKISNNE